MNTTQKAFQRFVRACNQEARLAAFLGQRKYAAALRRGASEALIEHRAAMPTPAALAPIDPELAKRRAIARAWAETMSVGMGQPPRPARSRS